MEKEQVIVHLLVQMKEDSTSRLEAKMNSTLEKMDTRIDANNEKFEVLRATIFSRKDIHQATRRNKSQDEHSSSKDRGMMRHKWMDLR
jgi:hypothetical protein